MGLNTGTLYDYVMLNKEHYQMTWDSAKELWDDTGLSEENRHDTQPNTGNYETMWGQIKGSMRCHRDEHRKFLYYHKTHWLSFARNITLQAQTRTKVIHSRNRKNCDGRKGWILFQQ